MSSGRLWGYRPDANARVTPISSLSMACQSQFLHIKSVLPVCVLRRLVDGMDGSCSYVWAMHPREGSTPPHVHMIVRFPCVRHWLRLRSAINGLDPHSYVDSARSWRRSVRYCLHLDNPEKVTIPRQFFHSCNLDEDELSQLLGNPRLDILDYLPDSLKRKPFDGLRYLLQHGFSFSDVSGAVNALSALSRYRDMSRCANHSRTVLDDDYLDSFGLDESESLCAGGLGGRMTLPEMPSNSFESREIFDFPFLGFSL